MSLFYFFLFVFIFFNELMKYINLTFYEWSDFEIILQNTPVIPGNFR